jgi:hypothetical protein
MRSSFRNTFLVLLLASACGPDPRDAFVGNWQLAGMSSAPAARIR